jgi:hypothetical protein
VLSDIKGRFHYCEDELTIDVDGELFAEPVRLKMRADRERLSLNDTSMPMPDHLHEAIIVGFVRMGLLHNIIRLSGNLIPDHGEGGCATGSIYRLLVKTVIFCSLIFLFRIPNRPTLN